MKSTIDESNALFVETYYVAKWCYIKKMALYLTVILNDYYIEQPLP